jgi:LysR substrate binding domain-containing protein
VPLGTTAAGIAIPRDHGFARRQAPLTLSDLAGERVLVWSRRSAATTALQEMLDGIEVDWRVSTVVGRDGLADVARGAAIAVWPVDDEPRTGVRLVALDPPLELPVVAVLRRGAPTTIVRGALDAFAAALG